MLHFSPLLYYVIPALPLISYAVPSWLSIELKIFASRLYMNLSESAGVKRYLRLFQCRKPTEPGTRSTFFQIGHSSPQRR